MIEWHCASCGKSIASRYGFCDENCADKGYTTAVTSLLKKLFIIDSKQDVISRLLICVLLGELTILIMILRIAELIKH